MAANKNNQKISQIRELPSCTNFPTQYQFKDPGLLELTTLLLISQTFTGGTEGRKRRDMSTRLTYGQVYKILFNLLTTNVGESSPYTVSGKFNFATHGSNLYCANSPKNGSPGGRNIINYNQTQLWFNASKSNGGSGFANTLKNAGYKDDHTNDAFDPNPQ